MVGGGEAEDLAPYWSRWLWPGGVMKEWKAVGMRAFRLGLLGDDPLRRRRRVEVRGRA